MEENSGSSAWLAIGTALGVVVLVFILMGAGGLLLTGVLLVSDTDSSEPLSAPIIEVESATEETAPEATIEVTPEAEVTEMATDEATPEATIPATEESTPEATNEAEETADTDAETTLTPTAGEAENAV